MVVVKLGAPHADGDVQVSRVAAHAALQGPQRRLNRAALLFGDFIRHEVRRGIAFFFEGLKIPVQLVGKNRQKWRGLSETQGRDEGQ